MASDKDRSSNAESQLVSTAAPPADHLLVKPYIPPVPAFIKSLYNLPVHRSLQQHLSDNPILYQTVINTLNHPLMGLKNTVMNIDDALRQVDHQTVADIANVYSFKFEIDNGSSEVRQLWMISEQMARFAAILSSELSISSRQKVAPLMMMHHCGLASMLTKYPNYMSMVKMGYRSKEGVVTFYEDVAINTNHAVVGEMIALSRSLPAHYTDVIGYQHDINYINERRGDHLDLLCLLKAAQDIVGVHEILGKAKKNYEWDAIQETVLGCLGLSKKEYGAFKQRFNE